MSKTPSELLQEWIFRQLREPAGSWFKAQLEKLEDAPSQKVFDIAFGMIPRKLGKEDLQLNAEDLKAAEAARTGWDPRLWSVDVAARIVVLIGLSQDTSVNFSERFKELHRIADVGELLALYSGLPLYLAPEMLVEHAAFGLRTNIKAEFEAIAHKNPFPAEQFDENPWNNMVLKALFIGVMLEPIQGLDRRANPELARILSDYAHERWAAERLVSPELWRCIGPFATGEFLQDFQRLVDRGSQTEKKAAALALITAPASDALDVVRGQLNEFDETIASGALTWAVIADDMFENSLAITRKLNTEVELKR